MASGVEGALSWLFNTRTTGRTAAESDDQLRPERRRSRRRSEEESFFDDNSHDNTAAISEVSIYDWDDDSTRTSQVIPEELHAPCGLGEEAGELYEVVREQFESRRRRRKNRYTDRLRPPPLDIARSRSLSPTAGRSRSLSPMSGLGARVQLDPPEVFTEKVPPTPSPTRRDPTPKHRTSVARLPIRPVASLDDELLATAVGLASENRAAKQTKNLSTILKLGGDKEESATEDDKSIGETEAAKLYESIEKALAGIRKDTKEALANQKTAGLGGAASSAIESLVPASEQKKESPKGLFASMQKAWVTKPTESNKSPSASKGQKKATSVTFSEETKQSGASGKSPRRRRRRTTPQRSRTRATDSSSSDDTAAVQNACDLGLTKKRRVRSPSPDLTLAVTTKATCVPTNPFDLALQLEDSFKESCLADDDTTVVLQNVDPSHWSFILDRVSTCSPKAASLPAKIASADLKTLPRAPTAPTVTPQGSKPSGLPRAERTVSTNNNMIRIGQGDHSIYIPVFVLDKMGPDQWRAIANQLKEGVGVKPPSVEESSEPKDESGSLFGACDCPWQRPAPLEAESGDDEQEKSGPSSATRGQMSPVSSQAPPMLFPGSPGVTAARTSGRYSSMLAGHRSGRVLSRESIDRATPQEHRAPRQSERTAQEQLLMPDLVDSLGSSELENAVAYLKEKRRYEQRFGKLAGHSSRGFEEKAGDRRHSRKGGESVADMCWPGFGLPGVRSKSLSDNEGAMEYIKSRQPLRISSPRSYEDQKPSVRKERYLSVLNPLEMEKNGTLTEDIDGIPSQHSWQELQTKGSLLDGETSDLYEYETRRDCLRRHGNPKRLSKPASGRKQLKPEVSPVKRKRSPKRPSRKKVMRTVGRQEAQRLDYTWEQADGWGSAEDIDNRVMVDRSASLAVDAEQAGLNTGGEPHPKRREKMARPSTPRQFLSMGIDSDDSTVQLRNRLGEVSLPLSPRSQARRSAPRRAGSLAKRASSLRDGWTGEPSPGRQYELQASRESFPRTKTASFDDGHYDSGSRDDLASSRVTGNVSQKKAGSNQISVMEEESACEQHDLSSPRLCHRTATRAPPPGLVECLSSELASEFTNNLEAGLKALSSEFYESAVSGFERLTTRPQSLDHAEEACRRGGGVPLRKDSKIGSFLYPIPVEDGSSESNPIPVGDADVFSDQERAFVERSSSLRSPSSQRNRRRERKSDSKKVSFFLEQGKCVDTGFDNGALEPEVVADEEYGPADRTLKVYSLKSTSSSDLENMARSQTNTISGARSLLSPRRAPMDHSENRLVEWSGGQNPTESPVEQIFESLGGIVEQASAFEGKGRVVFYQPSINIFHGSRSPEPGINAAEPRLPPEPEFQSLSTASESVSDKDTATVSRSNLLINKKQSPSSIEQESSEESLSAIECILSPRPNRLRSPGDKQTRRPPKVETVDEDDDSGVLCNSESSKESKQRDDSEILCNSESSKESKQRVGLNGPDHPSTEDTNSTAMAEAETDRMDTFSSIADSKPELGQLSSSVARLQQKMEEVDKVLTDALKRSANNDKNEPLEASSDEDDDGMDEELRLLMESEILLREELAMAQKQAELRRVQLRVSEKTKSPTTSQRPGTAQAKKKTNHVEVIEAPVAYESQKISRKPTSNHTGRSYLDRFGVQSIPSYAGSEFIDLTGVDLGHSRSVFRTKTEQKKPPGDSSCRLATFEEDIDGSCYSEAETVPVSPSSTVRSNSMSPREHVWQRSEESRGVDYGKPRRVIDAAWEHILPPRAMQWVETQEHARRQSMRCESEEFSCRSLDTAMLHHGSQNSIEAMPLDDVAPDDEEHEEIEVIFVEESFMSTDSFSFGETKGVVFDWIPTKKSTPVRQGDVGINKIAPWSPRDRPSVRWNKYKLLDEPSRAEWLTKDSSPALATQNIIVIDEPPRWDNGSQEPRSGPSSVRNCNLCDNHESPVYFLPELADVRCNRTGRLGSDPPGCAGRDTVKAAVDTEPSLTVPTQISRFAERSEVHRMGSPKRSRSIQCDLSGRGGRFNRVEPNHSILDADKLYSLKSTRAHIGHSSLSDDYSNDSSSSGFRSRVLSIMRRMEATESGSADETLETRDEEGTSRVLRISHANNKAATRLSSVSASEYEPSSLDSFSKDHSMHHESTVNSDSALESIKTAEAEARLKEVRSRGRELVGRSKTLLAGQETQGRELDERLLHVDYGTTSDLSAWESTDLDDDPFRVRKGEPRNGLDCVQYQSTSVPCHERPSAVLVKSSSKAVGKPPLMKKSASYRQLERIRKQLSPGLTSAAVTRNEGSEERQGLTSTNRQISKIQRLRRSRFEGVEKALEIDTKAANLDSAAGTGALELTSASSPMDVATKLGSRRSRALERMKRKSPSLSSTSQGFPFPEFPEILPSSPHGNEAAPEQVIPLRMPSHSSTPSPNEESPKMSSNFLLNALRRVQPKKLKDDPDFPDQIPTFHKLSSDGKEMTIAKDMSVKKEKQTMHLSHVPDFPDLLHPALVDQERDGPPNSPRTDSLASTARRGSLKKSLPEHAKQRNITSALPGSLLWEATVDKSGDELSSRREIRRKVGHRHMRRRNAKTS